MASSGFDSARWIQNDLQEMRSKVPGHTPPVYGGVGEHHGFERRAHSDPSPKFMAA